PLPVAGSADSGADRAQGVAAGRYQCRRGGDHGPLHREWAAMIRLAILGASGHGKVVADCAELCGWSVVEFFDDAWPGSGPTACGQWWAIRLRCWAVCPVSMGCWWPSA